MTFAHLYRFLCAWALGLSALLLPAASTESVGSGTALENRQPTIELNYMICQSGPNPYGNGGIVRTFAGSVYTGEIRLFAGNFTPKNWLPCDGRLLPIAGNQTLFAYIGTVFGGNGSTNFALPDLRGRVPVGVSPSLPLGTVIGTAAPSLTLQQMPAHTHTLAVGGTTSAGETSPLDNRQPGLALHHLLTASTSGPQFVGELVLFAGTPPVENPSCDGSLLQINQNAALFEKLKATFGGNGTTDFALPDLRGRAVIGAGQAPGGSTYAFGSATGLESLTLDVTQLPDHTHAISGGATGATGQGAAVNNRQPTLALNHQIVTSGIFPSPDSTLSADFFLAEVRIYATLLDLHPALVTADGRLLTFDPYDSLVTLLGTRYGGTEFVEANVPDLRGRLAAGAIAPAAPVAVYGVETYTLTAAQLPAHTHDILSARELWRMEYFDTSENAGDAADSATPRGDGVPNLLKFATGLDPRLTSTQPGAIARNGTNLEFVYPRSITAAAEVTFIIEWSDTLAAGSWSTSGVTEEVLGTADGVQTVNASVPFDPATRRFIRLRVTP